MERETAWEVHKLLHQLDEPYREVFSLRVLGELSFSQIGQLFRQVGQLGASGIFPGENGVKEAGR